MGPTGRGGDWVQEVVSSGVTTRLETSSPQTTTAPRGSHAALKEHQHEQNREEGHDRATGAGGRPELRAGQNRLYQRQSCHPNTNVQLGERPGGAGKDLCHARKGQARGEASKGTGRRTRGGSDR